MSIKRDYLWLSLAFGLFLFSLWTFFKLRNPVINLPNETPLFETGLTLVGLIEADDCLTCIEKLLCIWEKWEVELESSMPELDVRLFFASQDGIHFPREALSSICSLPNSIEFADKNDPSINRLLASPTPAVMIYFEGILIYQVPIFMDTKMDVFTQELARILTNLIMKLGL